MNKEQPVNLSCSYCGKSQREVRKLIAGPTVYICDECIKLCNDILAEAKTKELAVENPPQSEKKERAKGSVTLCCSFCGKEQHEVTTLIAGPSVYICNECIGLCNDIIAEEIDKEETAAALEATLPEGVRGLIAAILERGLPAAERILGVLDPRIIEDTVGRRAAGQPPDERIWGPWNLARDWKDLHQLLGRASPGKRGSRPDDGVASESLGASSGQGTSVPGWALPIVERLSGISEVLGVLGRRLEEPGLEEVRPSVDLAREKLREARELLLAGPPRPPVD